jgi:hypothetical protein
MDADAGWMFFHSLVTPTPSRIICEFQKKIMGELLLKAINVS